MKTFQILAVVGLSLCAACTGSLPFYPDVHLEMRNLTSTILSDAELVFNASGCNWGYLGVNGSAYIFYYTGKLSSSAEVRWKTNDVAHAEKIDLGESFPGRRSGVLRFTIYDDHVTADFRKEISESGSRL